MLQLDLAGLRIDGRPLALKDGTLWLGEQSYGPLAPGDRVVIDAAGVSVNGTLRGALPGGGR